MVSGYCFFTPMLSASMRQRNSEQTKVNQWGPDSCAGKFTESKMTGLNTAAVPMRVNKTLTAKTRKEIFARDRHCQFKDVKTGRICKSTYLPQTDHKTSQWAGGNHTIENLQVLCASHNQFKYRKEAGISG